MFFGCEISFIFSGYLLGCISAYHLKPSHHLTIGFKLPLICGRRRLGRHQIRNLPGSPLSDLLAKKQERPGDTRFVQLAYVELKVGLGSEKNFPSCDKCHNFRRCSRKAKFVVCSFSLWALAQERHLNSTTQRHRLCCLPCQPVTTSTVTWPGTCQAVL